jgi:hypothetical protein
VNETFQLRFSSSIATALGESVFLAGQYCHPLCELHAGFLYVCKYDFILYLFLLESRESFMNENYGNGVILEWDRVK